jgi:electron transfer flavoprotein beta subunit
MTVAILIRRAQARPGQFDEHQVLGPCERGALTLGLSIARQLTTDAVAIAVGPTRREDRVLAMALRAGCARGVRVWSDGVDDLDYLGIAEILAAASKKVSADVVVCGDRSLDERTGAMAPALGELLGCPHVTSVASVRIAGRTVELHHDGPGPRWAIRLQPPLVLGARAHAVLARDDGPSQPAASTQSIVSYELADLGIDLRRLHTRRAPAGRLRVIRGARQATILGDAGALIARLRDEHLLPALEPAPGGES